MDPSASMRLPLRTVVTLSTVALLACGEAISTVQQNTPPTVILVSPIDGSLFSGGDDLSVEITATDVEDGALGDASISWYAELRHDAHAHPFLPSTAGAKGTASIPRVGHLETNIFYRIYAVAVDADGAADTVFVDVEPRLMTITFETDPVGLRVTVDGQPRTTPVDIGSVVGMERALDVPTPQSSDGTSHDFDAWSHGPTESHTYTAPAGDVTLTASFSVAGVANVSPSVSITAPTGGATVTAGTPVSITANATDTDGTVADVDFLEGTTAIGSDATAPYAVSWTPSGTGPRALTARATDDDGAITTSAVVNVTVQASGGGDVTAPSTTLTAPDQGTTGLTGSLALSADATDDVGVTEVEFQVDGETIGTDGSAPYEVTLSATSDYTTGAHTARARARDAAGNWSPWSAASVTFGGNVDLPAGFTQSTFASGFGGRLTAGAFAPDGRLFALEQSGAVRVVSGGTLLAAPFITLGVRDEGERGLLGIAFHPDFSTNNYVFLYYTTDEGGTVRNRISRFTANGSVAVPSSEVVMVELDALSGATNHNGGAMAFGADGMLYVAVGDNASSAQAQSLTTRHGKMLRYTPAGTIPLDNPLLGSTTGANQAIWALGLRNPFTFGVQPGTGRIHINDVGQGTWEEINLGAPGANYGWPDTEGPTTNPAYVTPMLAYRHSSSPTLFTGRAIVGGAFYDPTVDMFGAAYGGDYFFADFVSHWVYRLDSDGWDTAYAFARPGSNPTNLLVGDDGALYVFIGSRVERIAR